MLRKFFTLLLLVGSITVAAQNTDNQWFLDNYSKKEVYIPMRDGVKLFTTFYVPNDVTEKHPFLMTRTPYSCSPYGAQFSPIWNSYKMAYAKEHYIFVMQDVRGRYMSEGEFVDVRPFITKKKGKQFDEASDSYDAIDWMVKNIPNNNGKVGVTGTSYPGFYSTEAALSGHPALKAVSPQAPVTDWFMGDDFHHNGAFFQMDAFSFYPSFGKSRPIPIKDYGSGFKFPIKDNYAFYLQAGTLQKMSQMIGDSIKFWHEMMSHPNYDAWWQARNARVGLYNVKPAMLWVGGLFDAEDCWGAWNSFKATEKQSPLTNNKIVMGPWYHGQWSREGSFLGNVRFGSNTSEYFQNNIEIPFFNYYLKGKGTVADLQKASIFFTGENTWKTFDAWPPKDQRPEKLWISENNTLSFSNATNVLYEYTSDPAHPVPYTEDVHQQRTREYMTDDQRFASRRPDVLTLSMPVTEDITLAGPVIADLLTTISTTDADFIVKLIDVFPEDYSFPAGSKGNKEFYLMPGYQMLVRGEVMRGRFRNSFTLPEAFVPGQATRVKFELPDVAHTFKKGHQLMIQIQSTWFPLVSRNPQTFTDVYHAAASDFQKSTIQIMGGANGTYFLLPILKS